MMSNMPMTGLPNVVLGHIAMYGTTMHSMLCIVCSELVPNWSERGRARDSVYTVVSIQTYRNVAKCNTQRMCYIRRTHRCANRDRHHPQCVCATLCTIGRLMASRLQAISKSLLKCRSPPRPPATDAQPAAIENRFHCPSVWLSLAGHIRSYRITMTTPAVLQLRALQPKKRKRKKRSCRLAGWRMFAIFAGLHAAVCRASTL